MRIAFIEPSIANVEPLGVAYLAQSLMNAGHEVRYFEAPRPNLINRLKDFGPDVLAYSITTGKHRVCRELNSSIRREIDAISIFGGPHCTFSPEFIESDIHIDGVCRGEGEYAIVDLLGRIGRSEDHTSTENWWIRKDGKIYKNPVREKIVDIDTLPFPNREVIYAENTALRDSPIKRLIGSRGCPFNCSYCFNGQYNVAYQGKGKIYRQRSVSNIVREIAEIKEKYPLTFLKFAEDIFGLTMDYREFAEVYSKEAGIPFLCSLRPNLITEEKVRWLKKANCVAVVLAVESGNETVRNRILNRKLSADVLENAISVLKKEGMRVWTQNIIANPGETFDVAMETFKFNEKHKVEFAECFLLAPYPGTAVHDYCVKNNYFDGQIDILQTSYWLNSSLRFDSEREKRRLVNFHKFFSFGVQHPGAMFLIRLLVELPPNKFFVLFNRLYDGWRISRVIRAKLSTRDFLSIANNNYRYIKSFILKNSIFINIYGDELGFEWALCSGFF